MMIKKNDGDDVIMVILMIAILIISHFRFHHKVNSNSIYMNPLVDFKG